MKVIEHQDEFDLILDLLKEHPKGLCIKIISQKLGLNRNSVARLMDILHLRGRVDIQYYGKAKVFSLSNRVPFSRALTLNWDYLVAVNRDAKILFMSDLFSGFLGIPGDSALDTPLKTLQFPPFNDPATESALKKALKGEESGTETEFVYGGRACFFRLTCFPTIFENGKSGACIGMLDRTRVREVERTRDLHESQTGHEPGDPAEFAIRFHADTRIISVNDAYCRLRGKPREEIVGNKVSSVIPKKACASLEEKLRSVTEETPVVIIDLEVPLAGGGTRWERWRYQGLFHDGKVTEFRGVGFDISDIKRHASHLEKDHEGLRKIISEKTEKLTLTSRQLQKEISRKELLECNNRLSGFVMDTTSDMIAWIDRDGHMIYANKKMASFLDSYYPCSRETTFCDLFTATDRPDWEQVWEKLAQKAGLVFKGRIARGQGFPIQAEIALDCIPAQKKPFCCCVIRDVTDRRMAEHGLGGKDGVLRSVVEGSPYCQFVIDTGHRVLFWNKALEALTGFCAKDMIGTSDHWMPFYSEERPCLCDLLLQGQDLDFGRYYEGHCRPSPLVRDTFEGDIFLPAMPPDGKWLNFTATRIRDMDGTVIGALETLEDTTWNRKARDTLVAMGTYYRSLVENSSGLTAVTDERGNILYESPAILSRTGMRYEDVAGKNILQFVHPDENERLSRFLSGISARPGSTGTVEVRTEVTAGRYETIEWVAENLLHAEGIHGILLNGRVVTERKRREERLLKSEACYRGVLEDQSDLLFRWLPDYTITFVSDSLCRTMGRTRSELVGKNFLQFVPEEYADEIERTVKKITPANPVEAHINTLDLPGKGRTWHYWINRGIPDEAGNIAEYQSIGREIDIPEPEYGMDAVTPPGI